MTIRESAAASQGKFEDIFVEDWGVTVRIKAMSPNESADFMEARWEETGAPDPDHPSIKGFYPALIVATAVDPETGEMAFEPSDVDMLGNLAGQAATIQKLGESAARLCGLGKEAVDAGKDASSATPAAVRSTN